MHALSQTVRRRPSVKPDRAAAVIELAQVLTALEKLPSVGAALGAQVGHICELLVWVKRRLEPHFPAEVLQLHTAMSPQGTPKDADLLACLAAHIHEAGGELDLPEHKELKALLTQPRRPTKPPVWLSPSQAQITYRQVWTVRTGSKKEVRARICSYRRGGGNRRQWSAINLETGRKVRVVKVLEGSER